MPLQDTARGTRPSYAGQTTLSRPSEFPTMNAIALLPWSTQESTPKPTQELPFDQKFINFPPQTITHTRGSRSQIDTFTIFYSLNLLLFPNLFHSLFLSPFLQSLPQSFSQQSLPKSLQHSNGERPLRLVKSPNQTAEESSLDNSLRREAQTKKNYSKLFDTMR